MKTPRGGFQRRGLSESQASNTNTVVSGDNGATTMDQLAKQVSVLVSQMDKFQITIDNLT